MSINHQPSPRQDRRNKGRNVVMPHDGQHSVGTHKPVIDDPLNGRSVGIGNATPEGARAPGALGPPLSDEFTSSW